MGFGRGPSRRGPNAPQFDGFPQVDKRSIDQFILDFSSEIKYWKAVQCPCAQDRTGQPDMACNTCRGLGWAYGSVETDGIYQRAMVHSRRSQERDSKGGKIITGGVSVTLQSGIIPGDGDLIQVCKDREVVNNEYHTVGFKLRDGSSGETLRFRDVICIEKVLRLNVTCPGGVQDVPVSEWTFNASERKIDFLNGNDGDKYSVRYVAVPEYIVRADSAKPMLRVTHDDRLPDNLRTTKDIVYPYNVQAVRLDRAIIQRMRGAIDYTEKTTFNNSRGRGPFL